MATLYFHIAGPSRPRDQRGGTSRLSGIIKALIATTATHNNNTINEDNCRSF
jgi:hypothetical protein